MEKLLKFIKYFKLITIYCIVVLTVILIFYTSSEAYYAGLLNKNQAKEIIQSFGSYAFVGYILLVTLSVLSPLPESIVLSIGGFFFSSPYLTFFLSLVGIVFANSISFFFAKLLGKQFIIKVFHVKPSIFKTINSYMKLESIILFKLAPNLSIDIFSLLAGISKITYKDFIYGSIIGSLPGLATSILLGNAIANNKLFYSIPIVVLFYLTTILIIYILKTSSKQNKIRK